jgi:hypothetical protein
VTARAACNCCHSWQTVERMIPVIAVLAVGTVMMLAAQWRGWRPGLRTALAAGVVLRLAVWWLALKRVPQPWDFAFDFPFAGASVLHHQDPVLANPGRWHILPLMPFVLAAELKVGQLTHLSWRVAGKLAPVAADLLLIPLVGRLAGDRGLLAGDRGLLAEDRSRLAGNRGRLAAFQYACNPVSIMVCTVHGQWEPVSLALGVGALLVARSGRAVPAGLLGGVSAATGGWPILLFPGILLALSPSNSLAGLFRTGQGRVWRKWIQAGVSAAAVPAVLLVSSPLTVGTPVSQLPHVARLLIGARSIVGDWGWTAIVTAGQEQGDRLLAQIGKLILIAALLGTLYLWRRADPLRLTLALLIAFLVATPRMGVQYLMFPLPFLLARGGRSSSSAVVASAAWQGAGYFLLAGLTSYTAWEVIHPWWALSSLAVIGFLLAALPWSRRERHLTDVPAGTLSVDSAEEPEEAPPPAWSAGHRPSVGGVAALPDDG